MRTRSKPSPAAPLIQTGEYWNPRRKYRSGSTIAQGCAELDHFSWRVVLPTFGDCSLSIHSPPWAPETGSGRPRLAETGLSPMDCHEPSNLFDKSFIACD